MYDLLLYSHYQTTCSVYILINWLGLVDTVLSCAVANFGWQHLINEHTSLNCLQSQVMLDVPSCNLRACNFKLSCGCMCNHPLPLFVYHRPLVKVKICKSERHLNMLRQRQESRLHPSEETTKSKGHWNGIKVLK